MFSITYDAKFANSAAAYLIRPADGSAAIYRALAVVRLPDGRELRACLERTRGAGENGKAADSVVFYRNGRRCPEAHYSAAREFALAAFRRLYRAALAVDFDDSAPGWPSINDGQTAAELHAIRLVERAKENAEAARQRCSAADAARPLSRDPARPFRAWLRTPLCSTNWDFETLEAARDYLRQQIARCGGRVYVGGAPAGAESVDPLDSFIAWADGVETLADWGWQPDSAKPWGALWIAPAVETESPATAEASKPETIAIEMNWQAAAGIIRAALENGTGEGRRMAAVELGNMAKAADSGNEARRALLALATIANETAHCLGQPGSMARDEMDSAIAAAFALLTGEAPAANPLRDVAALAEYRLASDGCQAAGAIVLRRLPGNDVTPFVVHFRNDDDSRRMGRPAYYFGDYCATLAEAWEAFAAKLRRFDPTGRLGAAEAL